MKSELVKFFDKFAQDFKRFDGAVIASRYLAPYTAIHSYKSVSLYRQQKDIERYFASIFG